MTIESNTGSNRTFMELKCGEPGGSQGYTCSNRTFMELKLRLEDFTFNL